MTMAMAHQNKVQVPAWVRTPEGGVAAPSWLVSLQADALAHLNTVGFPTLRDEAWQQFSVAPLLSESFSHDDKPVREVPPPEELAPDFGGGPRLVFVNGVYRGDLSRTPHEKPGLTLAPLASVLETHKDLVAKHLAQYASVDRNPFAALNMACFRDGVFLHVAKGVTLDQSIQFLFVSQSKKKAIVSHPRVIIVAEAMSSIEVIETYVGDAEKRYFTNPLTELRLYEGAQADHYRVVLDGDQAIHIGGLAAHLDKDSRLTSQNLCLSGNLLRHDMQINLAGEGADCTLNGLYVGDDEQVIDNHIQVDHQKPHGASRQFYKGILDDAAKGVFGSQVIVREGAVQSDADQTNKNLLLSDRAEADPKPALEIYNNDVKCSHGATVGQLDENEMFYLRSRGIPEVAARNILVRAFAQDIMDRLKNDAVRKELEARLTQKLEGGQS